MVHTNALTVVCIGGKIFAADLRVECIFFTTSIIFLPVNGIVIKLTVKSLCSSYDNLAFMRRLYTYSKRKACETESEDTIQNLRA